MIMKYHNYQNICSNFFFAKWIAISFGKIFPLVHLYLFMSSKVKRRLEKKPPKRSTISTTPRFLMKKKGKAQGQKLAAGGEQKGEKKTKGQGLKKRNKTKKEEVTEKHTKASQKTGSDSSGAKLKK